MPDANSLKERVQVGWGAGEFATHHYQDPLRIKRAAAQRAESVLMIAVFLHPPKTTDSGEDFLVDEPDVIKWWDREKLPGNAALFDVDRLRSLVRSGKLRAALEPMEGFTMVMVVRRG